MLETPVLALTTGAWTMIGLLAGFTLVGLLALWGSRAEEGPHGPRKRYVFGVGKFPRLVELPEMRDVPATPDPLGPEGLRKLGKKADAEAGLQTTRYRMEPGVNRPWELSADIPDSVDAIEIQREQGLAWVTAEGHLTAEPPLSEAEIETFEELLSQLEPRHELRADRRTWAHSADSPEAINVKRV